MYEEFFSLSASPFRLNPDPKFFFGSRSHNKAMAYLHYGLRQAEGFIVITGEIGAGKSMLIGHLIDQLDRSNVVAAHLLTANLECSALLSHVLSAFRIEPSGTGKSAELEAFEDFLFDQLNRGRRVLLIVDEAQNLPPQTIEELRMLSNMQYDGTPLFQVFLIGQPQFRSILAGSDMEQFRQRVIASYHLEPLGAEETREYIRHRLSMVGWADDPAFSDDAFAAIFAATDGVPRRINTLCNRIFLHCAIEKLHAIDAGVVAAVSSDLDEEKFDRGAVKQAPEAAEAIWTSDEEVADAAASARGPVVVPFGGPKSAALKANARREAPRPQGERLKPAPEGGAALRAAPVADAPAPAKAEKKSAGAEAGGPQIGDAALSVFDRLRARRAPTSPAAPRGDARSPATLEDVAEAIAAATSAQADRAREAISSAAASDVRPDAVEAETPGDLESAEGEGWRRSVVRSLNETRDDLKSAHSHVDRLRRRLSEFDRRRRDRRQKIAANLARAESLLTEIRDAWR